MDPLVAGIIGFVACAACVVVLGLLALIGGCAHEYRVISARIGLVNVATGADGGEGAISIYRCIRCPKTLANTHSFRGSKLVAVEYAKVFFKQDLLDEFLAKPTKEAAHGR
jgi:hypothetical protein